MRQPYGRDIASTVVYAHPVWFARHGYNVVIQDVRGRGDSEGDFYPFRNEGADGADTIAWLRTRPESNGRVGMYGFSYQGMTQLLAAAEQPEGLQCISPGMTACDLYHGWFYQGGALRLASTLGWGLQLLKEDARRKQLREASDRLEQAWAQLASQTSVLPIRAHPALHGEGLAFLRARLARSRCARRILVLRSTSARRLEKILVPALHISGWYDMFLRGSVDGFLALRKSAGSDFARENQYLLAGPWVHIPWGDRIGTADFGPEALIDTDAILLRWFDHWLKDSGTFEGEPQVRHFVLGENRWREAETFPTEAEYALYLHSEGRANSRKGNGTLSTVSPDAGEPCDIFVHDPEVPVIAPGGPAAASGQFDQAALEMGNNLLVYSTEPLEKPLWVFGIPRVVLYCATSLCDCGLHRKTCARHAQWRGGIYLHRNRAVQPPLCRGRNMPRTKFTAGIFLSNPPPAVLPGATASGWKSPAAHFPSLTGIPGAMCLPAGRLRGIGGGRRNPFSTDKIARPLCICPRPRRRNERRRGASLEIEIAGVSKQYGNAHAVLESIDLVVAKQEFISLIGPSGCGKSTILKLIAGLAAPTSGAIRVDGMTPQNARETISFVFQDATLLPWRTVKQNIGLGLELERVPRRPAGKRDCRACSSSWASRM